MILKEYRLECDIRSESCRETHTSSFFDVDDLRQCAERLGWKALAVRVGGKVGVRVVDACPQCAATTPGAV